MGKNNVYKIGKMVITRKHKGFLYVFFGVIIFTIIMDIIFAVQYFVSKSYANKEQSDIDLSSILKIMIVFTIICLSISLIFLIISFIQKSKLRNEEYVISVGNATVDKYKNKDDVQE